MAPSQPQAYVSAFIEPTLRRALEEAAKLHDRSLSGELRVALRAHLASPRLVACTVGNRVTVTVPARPTRAITAEPRGGDMKTLGPRIAALIATALVVLIGATSAFGNSSADSRQTRTVEGPQFSFNVPWKAWESHTPYLSRSTTGHQAAEVVIFWAGLREGGVVAPCAKLLRHAKRRSIADLAAAVASAPGTKVVRRPMRVTIGGRPATHVVVTVLEDRGCNPGFFFTWQAPVGGAYWPGTSVGDTIKVWIVHVG